MLIICAADVKVFLVRSSIIVDQWSGRPYVTKNLHQVLSTSLKQPMRFMKH